MIESRQRAYLDAMGIPVWTLRQRTEPKPVPVASDLSLKLGPGNGGILLICATDTESASKLANDIGRSLGSVPVWSWPDSGADSVKPAVAVDQNLFTTVAVFGTALAEQFFGRDLPESVNSASLVLLPSMHELATEPAARRALWADLCRNSMVRAN